MKKVYIAILVIMLVSSGFITVGMAVEFVKAGLFAWVGWKLYQEIKKERKEKNSKSESDAE